MALKEIFEDEKGGLSYMRIASMIALFNGIGTGWYSLVNGKSAAEIVTAISIWLVAAFAPKVIQKFAEVKGTMPIFGGIPKDDGDNDIDSHTATPTTTSNSDTAK